MANNLQKDKRLRFLASRYELKRIQYKSIINNLCLPKEIRYEYVFKLNKLSRNTSTIRIKNRCILSGRGKGIYRFCKLSRLNLRRLSAEGFLPGIIKSCW